MEGRHLIVGLGNPGKEYDGTRHNIGFRIVRAMASKYGIALRSALVRVKGILGEGMVGDKKVFLLLPLTFMNDSGNAVRKCLHFYKLPAGQMVVIADDVALPLGTIRLRAEGSCGGHNGLKSVQQQLGTQEYPRLRIGVGDPRQGELADYVLDRFSTEEERILPDVVERAIEGVELWLASGIEIAMQHANRSK